MTSISKVLIILVLLAAALGACASATPTPAPTATPQPTATPEPAPTQVPPTPTEAAAADEPVLTLVGLDETVSLTLADLQAMPAVEGWGGIKNSVGNITVPALYRGVALSDLVDLVGGLPEGAGLSVVAEDGYAMTLAQDQVLGGNYVTYNPGTGDEIDMEEQLVAVLAYEVDGQPLPEKTDGRLRLVVLGSSNNQVTDGHWWVKWVDTIELVPQGSEWYLSLNGAISEEMDRATFESCSSPSCHGTFWTDADGHEWGGTPLYLVAARVDDENKHDFGGFNVELAEAGYTIQLIASDGYQVDIESVAAMRNENMVLAISLDGGPLPEEFYPLRLVGSDLAKSQMVGQVVEIKAILQPAGVSPAAEGEAALTITGLVDAEQSLALETLEGLTVVEITAEHPQKGPQDYTGVRLGDLLALAGPKWEAVTLRLIADDGFTADVDLMEVRACADCLIAFDGEGGLTSVMPGMAGMTWVKGLVGLELTSEPVPAAEESGPAEPLPEAPAGEQALAVTGLVEQPLSLSLETIQGMEVVQITAEHPKKGMLDYEGVRLNDLLSAARPEATATALVFTASDGYTAEASLADVLSCADCLLAFGEAGALDLVMPGLPSQLWVKQVVSIEVK